MNLLWTQSGRRQEESRFLARKLFPRARRDGRSSVKKEEKDGKEGKSVHESQSIQITSSGDFIEEDRKNIKSRWSCYFWVPVPVVSITILLDLADMENFVLDVLDRGQRQGFVEILAYKIRLADLFGDNREPDSNGTRQGNKRQDQWHRIVGYALVIFSPVWHGDECSGFGGTKTRDGTDQHGLCQEGSQKLR